MPIKTNQLKKDDSAGKAAKSKSARKRTRKRKTTKKTTGFWGFWRNEKFQRISGFFLIIVSFFLLLSFVSFLMNWFNGGSDDLFTVIPFRDVLFDDTLVAHNWGARLGAALSGFFIKK